MERNSDTHPPPPKTIDDDTTERLAGEDITEESVEEVGKPKKQTFVVSQVETTNMTNTNSDDNNSPHHQSESAEQPLEESSDSCERKTQTAEALLSSETKSSSTESFEKKSSEEPQNIEDDPPVTICTTTTTATTTNAEKTNKVNDDTHANNNNTPTSNIRGPLNVSRPKPLDKNSSRALSTPVSTFDTGSVGSLPSGLDSSVGRCDAPKNITGTGEQIETRSLPSTSQHQQQLEISHVQKIESSSVSGQCTNQNSNLGTAIQQQQPPPQQSEKQENTYDNEQTSQAQHVVPQQPQQTVYYQIPQIPSVVTLPVDSSQYDSSQNNYSTTQQQPPQLQQQQIQYKHHNEIQAGDQIIGMVGAIPIIKLQSGGMHYVKKKKGRFSLLQETPVIPNNGMPSGVSSRSQSPMHPRDTSVGITAPQTFDGKSAPTVKKKGRFFVTNVKDPGSILPNLQIQATTGAAVNVNDNNAVRLQQQQQQHQQFQHQQQQQQQVSPLQNQPVSIIQHNVQQSNVSQIPMQPVVIQPVTTMQQVYEIPHQQQVQQNYTHFSVSAAQDNQQQFSQAPMQNNENQQAVAPNNVQFSQIPVESYPQNQQQYVQYLPQVQHTIIDPSTYTVSGPISVAPVAQIQHDYQQQYLPPQQIPFSTNGPSTSQSYNVPTPPPTPGGVTPQSNLPSNVPSPMHSRSSSLNFPLPIAPIPKPPTSTNTEKQQQQPPHQLKTVSKKKKTVQGRSGKVPQTIGSNGTWSSVGLGKVFYLMDQMKTEVTEADQCIKSLQTDMKLLRDKNKDLEAKNRELDKKLRDEQVLREKVEMRNLDLRKKLRDAKGETTKAGKQNGKNSKEEKDGSRQNTESNSEKLRNGNVSCTETKPPVTSKTPEKMKPGTKKITSINGSSPTRDTITSDANVTTGNSLSHAPTALLSSSPVPQKSKLSITNQKEKNESNNAPDTATRPNPNRVLGGGKETEGRSRTSSAAAPPFIPPLRPPKNTPKPTGHKQTQSLHDFDPLKSTVPVISFPTPPSLEALPIRRSLTSDSMNPMSEMGNTFVSQDPFVVLGMAPSAIGATEGTIDQHPSPATGRQTLVANGYHGLQHQQFMVVPRQEPVMFDPLTGGVQQQIVTNIGGQWTNTYPHQHQGNTLQSQQFSGGSLQQQHIQQQQQQQIQQQLHQQQQQIQQQQLQQNQLHQQHLQQQHLQQQHQTHQMHQNPANAFDPFSSTS